jgi:putative hydrolase of the HAD superfamily
MQANGADDAAGEEGVDGVLFDLDGTLCEYERTTADMLELVHDVVGVDQFIEEREYVRKYGEYAADSDDMVDLRERCFLEIAEEKGRDPDLARELARVYAERRDHGNVIPLPGAVEAVETFARQYPVGLITNGAPEMQRRKLSAIGLDGTFDLTIFAGYEGIAAKPSPEPFDLALEELSLDPARTAYVGNHAPADVAGARASGLRSVLYSEESDPEPEPDHRIDSPQGLLDLPWACESGTER